MVEQRRRRAMGNSIHDEDPLARKQFPDGDPLLKAGNKEGVGASIHQRMGDGCHTHAIGVRLYDGRNRGRCGTPQCLPEISRQRG